MYNGISENGVVHFVKLSPSSSSAGLASFILNVHMISSGNLPDRQWHLRESTQNWFCWMLSILWRLYALLMKIFNSEDRTNVYLLPSSVPAQAQLDWLAYFHQLHQEQEQPLMNNENGVIVKIHKSLVDPILVLGRLCRPKTKMGISSGPMTLKFWQSPHF